MTTDYYPQFKRFLDDATRTYDAAVAEYPSEKLADGDLRSAVLACVGLDLWCLSRFHVHNAAAVREDVARTPHDTHIAVVADELRTAEELWEALERRLVAAPPATELSASSDLVWVLLELAKAAVKLDVSTDLAFKAANRVTTALLPALQQRLVRLADADADDDLVPALETLCDEIVRYYALGLTPMLDVNAKLAGQTGELADTIGTDLKRSCRFRSHHMHRTQLHAAQITNVLHRIAKEEFGARAVGMDERAVNDLLDASLTKGGTMVVMPTFRQHAAHELLKLNHARSVPYSLDASPRTSLEALVVFFNTRVGRRAEAPGAAQAPPPGGSALDDAHCSPLRQSGGRMSY
eukprot:TRINITY_DN5377_c1_g1_i2.p1 TRINITY_DN5377_c1_g1~~TRINITY_DN5377_c1_g1_i2.p1  ORF type:complete len:351 (+),score=80.66 TRINITY_DN5377_c1_g1_i2:73-1125(+)